MKNQANMTAAAAHSHSSQTTNTAPPSLSSSNVTPPPTMSSSAKSNDEFRNRILPATSPMMSSHFSHYDNSADFVTATPSVSAAEEFTNRGRMLPASSPAATTYVGFYNQHSNYISATPSIALELANRNRTLPAPSPSASVYVGFHHNHSNAVLNAAGITPSTILANGDNPAAFSMAMPESGQISLKMSKIIKRLERFGINIPEIKNLKEFIEAIRTQKYESTAINIVDVMHHIHSADNTIESLEQPIKEAFDLLFNALTTNPKINMIVDIWKEEDKTSQNAEKYKLILKYLTPYLKENTTIESLDLNLVFVDTPPEKANYDENYDRTNQALIDILNTNRKIKRLASPIGHEMDCLPNLGKALTNNSIVQSVTACLYSVNTKESQGFRNSFFNILATNLYLKRINLMFRFPYNAYPDNFYPERASSQEISSGFTVIGNTLATNNVLTHVTLSGLNDGKLKKTDLLSFVNGIIANNSITYLDFSSNSIGNKGASYFAHIILKKKQLTSLNLNYNEIYSAGAKALAEALSKREHETLFKFTYGGKFTIGYNNWTLDAIEKDYASKGNKNLLTDDIIKSFTEAAKNNERIAQITLGASIHKELDDILSKRKENNNQGGWDALLTIPNKMSRVNSDETLIVSFYDIIPIICDYAPEQFPKNYPNYLLNLALGTSNAMTLAAANAAAKASTASLSSSSLSITSQLDNFAVPNPLSVTKRRRIEPEKGKIEPRNKISHVASNISASIAPTPSMTLTPTLSRTPVATATPLGATEASSIASQLLILSGALADLSRSSSSATFPVITLTNVVNAKKDIVKTSGTDSSSEADIDSANTDTNSKNLNKI